MKFINELVLRLEEKNICMKHCTEKQIKNLISIARGRNLP